MPESLKRADNFALKSHRDKGFFFNLNIFFVYYCYNQFMVLITSYEFQKIDISDYNKNRSHKR